jgi:hypothetical protein
MSVISWQWGTPPHPPLLERGAACACAATAGTCAKIQEVEAALWTFARVEGLEPTSNAAERALRPAVLRRKRSFGNHSAAGCRYVSRLLSVVQTRKRQGHSVLDYRWPDDFRDEVLAPLLELNKRRAEQEQLAGPAEKPPRARSPRAADLGPTLYG